MRTSPIAWEDLITDEEVAHDWREFIVPDLEETIFIADVASCHHRHRSARLESGGGPGPLWITRDDAFQWYSALNQARLAIEERHRFGPSERSIPPACRPQRSAFLRSQFYCAVQSLLLEHVLR